MSSAAELVARIIEFVINPIIGLLFAAALVFFLWGGFQFISNAEGDAGRETGRRHMLWGIIGLFVMVSVIGILTILGNTFGFSVPPTPIR